MRSGLGLAVVALCLGAAPAQADSGLAGCDAFIEKLRIAASDLGVDFTHALIVSRARSDTDVFDITTKSDVDGTLTCRKDGLLRFEARIAEPASARAASEFENFQAAALRSALGWDAAKSRNFVRDMSADAREYLAASRERGDVYISGKTEEHVPGGVGLGLIVTDTDSAFIIVGGEE
ncbi:MAG: hypothetical protein ABR878_10475 [Roseiarcus sp.]|jgi:hypothetical protein